MRVTIMKWLLTTLVASVGTHTSAATDQSKSALGIPYAKAPIGELRWAAPEDLLFDETVKIEGEFGPVCPATRERRSNLDDHDSLEVG